MHLPFCLFLTIQSFQIASHEAYAYAGKIDDMASCETRCLVSFPHGSVFMHLNASSPLVCAGPGQVGSCAHGGHGPHQHLMPASVTVLHQTSVEAPALDVLICHGAVPTSVEATRSLPRRAASEALYCCLAILAGVFLDSWRTNSHLSCHPGRSQWRAL